MLHIVFMSWRNISQLLLRKKGRVLSDWQNSLKVFYLLLLETFSCQFEVVCDENTSLWFRDLILQPMPLILLLKNWLLLRLLEKVFAPNFITCLLSSIQLVLLFAHVIGFYWMFILKALELVLNPFRASYVQLYCLDTFWTTR